MMAKKHLEGMKHTPEKHISWVLCFSKIPFGFGDVTK
jgi:hypothetical protein